MRSFLLLALAVVLVPGHAGAEEPPAKKPKPLTVTQARDAVLVAAKGEDPAPLKALAAQDKPDPWLVADELCFLGEHDAADAFAKAAPRPDIEALPDYVAACRAREPDKAARELLDAMGAAMRSKEWQKVVDAEPPFKAPAGTVVFVRRLESRGRAFQRLKQPEAGEAALLEAAETANTLGWLRRAASLYRRAGLSACRRFAWAPALVSLEECVALCTRREDKIGAARVLGMIGTVHQKLGDYEKTLEAFKRLLTQMQELRDKRGEAQALANIGQVLQARGDYEKALDFLTRAMKQMEDAGDEAMAARTRNVIGNVHQSRGDHEEALKAYKAALRQMKDLKDEAGAARTQGNIGVVYQSQGRYKKAWDAHRKAHAEKKRLGDTAGAAKSLRNKALADTSRGRFAQALATYEEAQAGMEKVKDRAGVADVLGGIGNVHVALGDYSKALSYLERSREEMEKLGNKGGEAAALNNIGNVHWSAGDFEDALESYEEALAKMEKLGDKAGEATTLGNIGVAQDSLGQYKEALATYTRALDALKKLGNKAGEAMTLANIGEVHQHLGDVETAREFLKKSVRQAKSLKAQPQYIAALRMLAQLDLDTENSSDAMENAQTALDALEKLLGGLADEQGATARGQHATLFAVGTLAAVREGEAPDAFTFIESGRAGALLDMLGGRDALRWKAEDLPEELKRAEQEAQAAEQKARQAYEEARGSNAPLAVSKEAKKRLVEARKLIDTVDGRIQRHVKLEAESEYPRPKTIEDVQETLEEDQALVLYGLCLDEAVALVLRQDEDLTRIVTLGSAEDVRTACEELDASDEEMDPAAAIAALKKLLVTPLELGDDVKQVLVSPEGHMCYLPLGALFDKPVASTPSGSTHWTLMDEENEAGSKVLALGDPDYTAERDEGATAIYRVGGNLAPLPATRDEATAVGDVVLLGPDASEPGFREALAKEERWRAVHLACHGLVKPSKPMLSSLALTRVGEDDGFLTAGEVLKMEIPADLLVLSACETATGKIVKGEGIVGLTRSFMYAGCPRVLCSLWKVDDKATQALMIEFYKLWNPKEGEGIDAVDALQKAQAFIRGHKEWEHPRYWAAWVLWGLPN